MVQRAVIIIKRNIENEIVIFQIEKKKRNHQELYVPITTRIYGWMT